MGFLVSHLLKELVVWKFKFSFKMIYYYNFIFVPFVEGQESYCSKSVKEWKFEGKRQGACTEEGQKVKVGRLSSIILNYANC